MEHKLFVLVPVYKAEKFIDACITSVLQQSYGNFRLILVNDGSPDRSGEICDAYGEKDDRITVIHQENGGQISARNAAMDRMLLEAKETDIAVFLDSDDTLKANALETIHQAVEDYGCDLLIYGMDRVAENKILQPFRPEFSQVHIVDAKQQLYRTVFSSRSCNPLCRKAVTVKLLKAMRQLDFRPYHHIRFGEDLLQSIPLYEHCEKAVFIPESLYNYTFNPDSVSNNRVANSNFVDSTVRSTVLSFLEKQPEWTQSDMEDYLRYCRKLLVNSLRYAAKMKAGRQEKVRLLERIKADPYYGKILRTAGKKDLQLQLLKQGKYGLLLLHLNAYNLAVSGKHAVGRLFAR